MGGGKPARPPPAIGLSAIGMLEYALHAFTAALQGVVAAGFSMAVPSPAASDAMGKIATLSLLNLCFTCGMAVAGYLPPILEAVAQGKGSMERLSFLNQYLRRGLQSYRWFFGGLILVPPSP